MLEHVKIDDVLFLDIETVPGVSQFNSLDPYVQELWEEKKGKHKTEEDSTEAYYFSNAGIFAEFGKIICITVGRTSQTGMFQEFELISFYGDDEVKLLIEFSTFLQQEHKKKRNLTLCGHNIREFDIPYICRRMVVNQLPLPAMLDLAGKKPWETKHLIDTMELWKFGDSKNYTSLKLLAAVLGFPSPKDDIDGSDVGRVYWEDNDLDRLSLYCEKDVLATVQLLLRFKRMPLLQQEQIVHIRG